MPLNFNRSVYTQFMGYGNPNSNVWFMGREEASPWDLSPEEIENYRNITHIFRNELEPCEAGSAYFSYKQILIDIFPENYHSRNFFITNLFPFGIHNKDNYTPDQKGILGLNENDDMNTSNETFEERCIALRTFFRCHNWKNKYIFFCIGTDYRNWLNRFLEYLGVNIQNEYDSINGNEHIMKSRNSTKFILPHAARGYFSKHNVINTLRDVITD